MKIGDIYYSVNGRVRVLMFDEKDVFYQTVNEDDSFLYAKHKTISYFRITTEYFIENSKFIKSFEFGEQELEIHRPDLPLRLNCFSGLFWTNNSFENEILLYDFFKSVGINKDKLEGLNSSKIVIFPISQQLSIKKPVLLQNNNGFFTAEELLIECFRIQSVFVNLEKPYFSRFRLIPDGIEEKRLSGIGIYRNGIKGNILSYYLGGEISLAELESEKRFIVE